MTGRAAEREQSVSEVFARWALSLAVADIPAAVRDALAASLIDGLGMQDVTITQAGATDPERLADIRVAAMRPSLEAIGRFDPDRARARFIATYVAEDTFLLSRGGEVIGFYVLRNRPDYLYLDHLYLGPEHQGGGVGRGIVQLVQDQARDAGLPVRLMALRDSPANGFYQSCGFVLESADDLDNIYRWPPV